MPLNERRFNGSGLLKPFIRLSSGRSTHSSTLWVTRSRKKHTRAAEVPFEVLVRTAFNKAFSMEIWLALTFFLAPHQEKERAGFQVTSGAEAWSRINIRGVREQRDTQDLAAEEQIETKNMDIFLLLCALHFTCKYCSSYSLQKLVNVYKNALTLLFPQHEMTLI